MFCTQCGAARGGADHFCAQCGARIEVGAPAVPAAADVEPVVREAAIALGAPPPSDAAVRPWVRYWARMLDLYLFGFTLGVLAELSGSHFLDAPGSEQLWSLLMALGWVFTEASLLSTLGTTPGKALLRIRLVPPTNEQGRAPYGVALTRSLRVWWRGLGAGLPLVVLFTLLAAHRKLKANGASSWDIDGGWRVEHGHIGPWRALATVLLFLGLLGLVVVGSGGGARY